MMKLVDGKRSLVIGAGSGIGRATAILLAKEGAKVAVADRQFAAAQTVAAEIAALGGIAYPIAVDVGDQQEVAAMIRSVVEQFGRLDCAVNSAGVLGAGGPFADLADETWNANIAINLTGIRNCMTFELRHMRERGAGSIVNIASGAGLEGVAGLGAYVASKHGVIGATRSAALDHARDGIRINALAPGLIVTPMTEAAVKSGALDIAALCPIGRPGNPEEVAEAALWLCSDRASYVTGAVLAVDGGHLAG
jgi:NAD(P)-dependent dehydrogenase (short-subunit alcohol dehydrogenase family)